MSFVFATSHLPGIERPKIEEEEEDNAPPMLRAGGVRALSHLAPPLGCQLQRAGTAALRSRHEDGVAAALTQSGTPLKSAVQMTWTGLEAARHGFTEVEINHSIGENGKYTDIQVTYRKPGT